MSNNLFGYCLLCVGSIYGCVLPFLICHFCLSCDNCPPPAWIANIVKSSALIFVKMGSGEFAKDVTKLPPWKSSVRGRVGSGRLE